MPQRSVKVASPVGLHARPAATFVKRVAEAELPVTIAKPGGTPGNAASMLVVMGLGAKQGDEVVLSAEGDRAEQVLDDLAAFLESQGDTEPS